VGLAKNERVARFIEPMECLSVERIPEGDAWTSELKLDGYRLVGVETGGRITHYSWIDYSPIGIARPDSNCEGQL
jgi:ATP-dependent DNA ligase